MRIVVGVADLRVSDDPATSIVTYSLGSCIGLCVYDASVRVGGILHFMLPEAKLSPEKAVENPCMFADTGIPLLFREAYRLGAMKGRMAVKAAGGSQVLDSAGTFNIGKRNILALRRILWMNGVTLTATDMGGTGDRTMSLDIASGRVLLKRYGEWIGEL